VAGVVEGEEHVGHALLQEVAPGSAQPAGEEPEALGGQRRKHAPLVAEVVAGRRVRDPELLGQGAQAQVRRPALGHGLGGGRQQVLAEAAVVVGHRRVAYHW